MLRRAALLALLLFPSAVAAQRVGPLAPPPDPFESWTQPGVAAADQAPIADAAVRSRSRAGNALLGGAIGAAAGVVFCTVVSNIAKDEGTGFSTCTTKGYLLTGGIGFAIGLVVGLTVSSDPPPAQTST